MLVNSLTLIEMFFATPPFYGVYISQLRFTRVCCNVSDFNNRNKFLTAMLLKQGNRYHKMCKAFSKFYHIHSEVIVKYNFGLKTLLQQGILEHVFYGYLVYKFRGMVGKPNFSDQFKETSKRYKKLDITWISCNSLYFWLQTQLQFIAMVSSLIV